MFTTALTIVLSAGTLAAQPTSDSVLADRPNGPRSAEPTHHVIYNATIYPEPGVVWALGFVEFKDGVIIDAGSTGRMIYTPPPGAQAHDLQGEHVYAAFIDPWIEVEAPSPGDNADGRHWNDKVRPHADALMGEGLTESQRKTLREHGFAAAGIAPEDGIFAGLGAVTSTADPASDASKRHSHAYSAHTFQAMDFETAGFGRGGYPTSHPGAMALIRQTFIDADWQADNDASATNALTPLIDTDRPLMVDVDMELEHFLAADFASEFDRELVLVGNGMEFKWLAGLGAQHAEKPFDVVVPLRFPKKPDVSTVGKANAVELESMLEWEHAPTNPARLLDAGVTTALTTSKLPNGQKFFDNLHNAIEHGLDPDDAYQMLTVTPAEMLGVAGQIGTIEAGKAANLLVTSGELFGHGKDDHPDFYDLFVDGQRYRLNDRAGTDLDGDWTLFVGGTSSPAFTMDLTVSDSIESKAKIAVNAVDGDDEVSGDARKVAVQGDHVSFLIDDDDGGTGTYIMSGALTETSDGRALIGTGVNPDGTPFQWTALPNADEANEDAEGTDDAADADAEQSDASDLPTHPGYPFGPYAVTETPTDDPIVFQNATLWTSGPDGIIENGTLVISSGQIRYAGPARGAPRPRGATFIDMEGKHITPGLIDAHSHTSLFRMGVNEAGQAVTAEVRIGDSLDPSAVNWYRQLAMGVTSVLSLHGSANPIGGQAQIHKVRWGVTRPEDMRMEGAKPGIKFALGENVKQSNWGDEYTTRYPQTRMGVETIMRDRFIAAREYMSAEAEVDEILKKITVRFTSTSTDGQNDQSSNEVTLSSDDPQITDMLRQRGFQRRSGSTAAQDMSNALKALVSELRPRRDLELEAIAEILRGERLIHCHSYRQDEILMLCRLAEEFGFTIGSFTHGLEVYKVAEVVQNHALGASLFSDWWAYKYEVVDAIPHAGPLQTEAGVLTSYNSDSDELSRRMNLEAAKAQRYAFGFDQNDPAIDAQAALNFVTINPAIQLGIDDRIGSLEEGKDADVVVWSDDPLSVYANVEHVFIDGREYWSTDKDNAHRERIAAERQRLVQKILEDPSKSEDDEDTDEADNESAGDEGTDTPPSGSDRRRRGILADYMTSGPHPDFLRQGDCGCNIINHAIYYQNMND
ncbi:MAG: amidohydrolase family protein [Planctomycetota bacterium]